MVLAVCPLFAERDAASLGSFVLALWPLVRLLPQPIQHFRKLVKHFLLQLKLSCGKGRRFFLAVASSFGGGCGLLNYEKRLASASATVDKAAVPVSIQWIDCGDRNGT